MKSKAVKIIALIAALSVLMLSFTITNVVLAAEEQSLTEATTEYSSIIKELISEGAHSKRLRDQETDLYSLVYENEDGTNTLYMFAQPVKYIDKNGEVRDKSIALSEEHEKSGTYRYATADNDVKIYMPENVSDGVLIAYNDINITLSPVADSKGAHGAEKRGEKTVLYRNIFGENIDIEYTTLYNGVKENIILRNYIGVNEFSFKLNTGGMALLCEQEHYYLKAKDGTVFNIGEVLVSDSAESRTLGSMSVKTIKENEEYILTLSVDKEFLSGKDTVYPVYIDPTITLNYSSTDGKYIEDAAFGSGGSETLGNSQTVDVGYNSSKTYTYRAVYRLPCMYYNMTFRTTDPLSINTVYLKLYNSRSTTASNINVYYANTGWFEGTVSSSYYGAGYGDYTASAYVSGGGLYSFNITSAARHWRVKQMTGMGYSPENGLVFVNSNTTSSYLKTFSSTENYDSIQWPYIEINYSQQSNKSVFKIKNAGSNKYMNSYYGYGENTDNIYQYSSDDSKRAQYFRFGYDESLYGFRIYPVCSHNGRGRVLDIVRNGAPLASGQNVEIFRAVDNTAQLFNIVWVGGSNYKIVMKYNTSLALTANGNSDGSGSGKLPSSSGNIYISTYSSSNSYQHWSFEEVYTFRMEETYYSSLGWSYPFRSGAMYLRISSDYGYRTYNNNFHTGVDIPAPAQTELYAMMDGEVIKMSYSSVMGYYIVVESDSNTVYGESVKLRTIYMHLYEQAYITNNKLYEGCKVTTNILIGKVGNTGSSDGNHLHLSVITDGSISVDRYNTVEPLWFYPQLSFTYDGSYPLIIIE